MTIVRPLLPALAALLIAAAAWAEEPQYIRDASDEAVPPGAAARVGSTYLRERGYITVVTFTRDGKRLASGGEEGRVFVADAATGKTLLNIQPFPESHSAVTELAFSPDGRILAMGGYWMKEVRLFDLEARRLLHAIPNTVAGHERWAREWQGAGFAFTPDGKTLVMGGKNGSLLLCDVAEGRERIALSQSKEPVMNLALSADGRTALTSHYAGEVHLWDVAGEKHLRRIDAKAKYPHLTALATDGKTIAQATDEKVIELHDAAGGLLHKLTAKAIVYGLGFDADGKALHVAGADGSVTNWDVRSGQEQRRLAMCEALPVFNDPRHGAKVWAWFRPDGRSVAWADMSTLRLFDLTTGKETPKLPGLRQGVNAARFSADGKLLILGGNQSGELAVWNWGEDRQVGVTRRTGPRDSIYLAVSSDRRKSAVTAFPLISDPREGGRGAHVFLWDHFADAEPVAFQGEKPVWSAVLSPDNRYLVTSELDQQIRVYDAATRKLVRSFAGPKDGYPLTFSSDGSKLAVRTPDRKLRVYRFSSGQLAYELDLPHGLMALAFSADGALIATGHVRGLEFNGPEPRTDFVCVWDAVTGRERRRFLPDHSDVTGLAFSPDARLLVSCGHEGTVRLWELVSGQMRRKYDGHKSWVNSVDFAPDGHHVASASSDGTAIVWRVFDAPAGPVDLEAAWADLARGGESAHRAVGGFVAAKSSVAFLAERLKPAAVPPPEQLQKWIADLGSPRFAARTAAEKELARAGELAEAALRQAQQAVADAEIRRRLVTLVDKVSRPEGRPEQLRELRAVEVLERIGSADAKGVLEKLAKGAPEALLTIEAKISLKRLAK